MRKLLFILLFIPTILCGQRIYYIDPGGSDSYGDGSAVSPWRSLKKASQEVTLPNSIIYVNPGTYNENDIINISVGVSIQGSSQEQVRVESTYGGSGQPLLKLETWNGWTGTYGNQSISGITFDGNMITYAAIYINYRSNVKIYDCTIRDFVNRGVQFTGQPSNTWTVDNPYNDYGPGNTDYPYIPSYWCTGNEFYGNTVINCAMHSTWGQGALRIGCQDGFKCYNNYFRQTGRSYGTNGYLIKFGDKGFNKNCKIYNNELISAPIGDNPYGFAIEWWWDLGGTDIYNNTMCGAMDFVNMVDHVGAGYSINFYNNYIGWPSLPSTQERGILLEGKCEYMNIYQNKIERVARAFYIPRQNYTGSDRLYHINIYSNLMVNLGQTTENYRTWGFYYSDFRDEGETQYLLIQNNVIHASPYSGRIPQWGIQMPHVNEMSYIYIENNIIMNWNTAAVYGYIERDKADHIYIRNNLIYGSGQSNDPGYTSAYSSSLTNYTYSGTVKADPLFESDYRLGDGSPAIAAGRYVGWPVDYYGYQWLNPPSIGACEYMSEIPEDPDPPDPPGPDPPGPEPPAYIGKIVKQNGQIVKTNSKIVKR
jgi:hypothetical protein